MNLNYNPCKIKFSSSSSSLSSLSGTDCSLFVMTALCVRGKSLNKVERDMQLCVSWLAFEVLSSPLQRRCVSTFTSNMESSSCIWIGSSVGSDPPSGLAHRFGGFPHISCPKSMRRHMNRPWPIALNYFLKIKSLPENPSYSCVFEPENVKL